VLLAPDRSLGRNLDPLDAADGGASVRLAPRFAYSLHPQTTLVDASPGGEAPRISAPVRKVYAGVVPTLTAEPIPVIPWDRPFVAPVPEDVSATPPPPPPPPVADPARPARPPVPGRITDAKSDAAAARDLVGFLAVVAVVVVLLSR